VFRSFLISQHRFALSSAAGFFTNAVVIASVVGLFGRFGYYSIVLGYLVGCLLSLTFLGAQIVLAFPVRYSFTLQGTGDAFRKLHGAGAAQLGGAAAWQGVVIAERIIASFLPAGTLTALGYGLKILSALVDLLAGSVGTVALPALSRAVAHQDQPEMRKLFRDVLEISMMFALPAFIFCGLLSGNIIRLVFERGSFTPEATALLARVFFYYSLAILPFAFTRLLTFYFFARHEGGDYLRFALLLYSLTLMFDLIYVAGFRLGAKGIPLGLLTASLLAVALAYQRNMAGLRIDLDRALGWFTLKNALAGSLAGLAVVGLKWTVQHPQPGAANFVYLCELCGAGTLVFFAALAATRAVPVAKIFAEITRSEDS
jgi:putative peptidoglycan lipid II flippase